MQQAKITSFTSYQIFLILVFVFMLFTIVVDYMTLPALSAILLAKLEISPKEFGLLVSVYAFSAGISSFLATSFADSFDRKKLLLVYYGGFLLGMFLCATSSSLTALIIARIVTGIFGGMIASICFAIVADLFEPDQRGRVMGYIQMAFAASLVAGMPLALSLATHFDWHITYWVFLIVGAIIWGLVFFIMKPIKDHLWVKQQNDFIAHALNILLNRPYWNVFLNNIFLVLGDAMFMTFASAYLANNLKLSLEDLPLLFGIGGIATLVLSPLLGKLSDKLGKLPVFVGGTLLAIVFVFIYSHIQGGGFWLIVCIHSLLFVGINARMISSTALTTVVPQASDRGAFLALDASLQQIAGGLAATTAGLIVTQTPEGMINGYPKLAYVVIAILLATIGFMYLINKNIAKSL